MRALTTLALTAALLLGATLPAAGHVGLTPGVVAPGAATTTKVVLAHGCGPDGGVPPSEDEASATRAVDVTVPDGVTLAALPAPGWSAEEHELDGIRHLRWESEDPAGVVGAVSLDVEVAADADLTDGELWLPVLQDCADGASMAWDHQGPAETVDELPALRLTVATPVAAGSGSGLPTPVVVTLAIALAVVAGGGVVAWPRVRELSLRDRP